MVRARRRLSESILLVGQGSPYRLESARLSIAVRGTGYLYRMTEQKSHRPFHDDPLERQRDAGYLFKTLDLSVRSPNRFVGTLRDVEYPMSARVVLLAQSGDLRLRCGAPAQGFDPFVGRGALHEVFYFHFFSCLICIRSDGQKTAFSHKYNQKRNKIQMPLLMTKLHRTRGALPRPRKTLHRPDERASRAKRNALAAIPPA